MSILGIGYTPAPVFSATGTMPRKAALPLAETANPLVMKGAIVSDGELGLYDITGQAVGVSAGYRTAQPNGYEIYMPTRPGYSSNNLALAVTDPGAEPFSSGLSKDEVAIAARKAIDARYAQLVLEGKPFDNNSFEGKDWYSAFGDLDRRALNAILTDKSGQFSEEEKGIAQSIMSQQQGLATGAYAGPTSLQATYAKSQPVTTLGPEDTMSFAKRTIEWLDKLSTEEKTTSRIWVDQRAGSQWVYEHFAAGLGVVPEDLSSGLPFVDMLVQARRELEVLGAGHDLEETPSYAKAWELFDLYGSMTDRLPVALYL